MQRFNGRFPGKPELANYPHDSFSMIPSHPYLKHPHRTDWNSSYLSFWRRQVQLSMPGCWTDTQPLD